jgi:adenine-specific DNA methylase
LSIVPFAWRDKPSLIERLLPAQKISAEAQKERKAGAGQTLTALGSYWKGRKPLILVKACILGALLPATDDQERDLEIFEKLMAIDDEAFLRRGFRPSCFDIVQRLYTRGQMRADEAESLFEVRHRTIANGKPLWELVPFLIGDLEKPGRSLLQWQERVSEWDRDKWRLRWVRSFSYLERVYGAKRPEELDQDELFEPVWDDVNAHLGTEARSFPELIEQLGTLRYGKRPRVGDTFCGGGSIPFEAARIGCDVYASDLNPIACMLTWGALNVIGGSKDDQRDIQAAQAAVVSEVDREITQLSVEHDCQGNRAKAYLYCLEVRCPQTGWLIPLCSNWIISTNQNVIARLVPDHSNRRFAIEIVTGVSPEELEKAAEGTLQEGDVVYELGGEVYRTKFRTIRGDTKLANGKTTNKLRRWEKLDFAPRSDDILQERLYCIQWITKDTLAKGKPQTFFAGVTEADLDRERKVEEIVRDSLPKWQADGLVPDMPIEPGEKTDEPIRTRGWTHWHHLFNARQLMLLSMIRSCAQKLGKISAPALSISFAHLANRQSKLCRLDVFNGKGREPKLSDTFTNQALNTLSNYGTRASLYMTSLIESFPVQTLAAESREVVVCKASDVADPSELWITDPPYADAIRYEEITEYFIAWLRKNPPPPFDQWVWDSRRPLAIKGTGDDFRGGMTAAYRAMADHMPDNGLQIVMFTHQDAGVWADMAAIVWGAGLQVSAAWYITTETSSELKKGGYVQGTVLLVLRKRMHHENVYRDELVQSVRTEVARQIETMTGLNQSAKGAGRSENLFEDQDLQMAGYAAALRVLTGYSKIDGQDMAAEALRPRQSGGRDMVKEIIDFAVQVANEYLVPEGIAPGLWERLSGPERFYLRMLDIEAGGAKKLDSYQNFAKAFRYGDYSAVMASTKANDARLKTALELKRAEFESGFGKSPLRAVLFALYELQREVDIDEVIGHLRDLVPGYLSRRDDLMALATAIASKRETKAPAEAQAARILFSRIKNERLR